VWICLLTVHVHGVVLSIALGTLTVEEVLALGLSELVNLSTCKASEELLGELVRDRLA